jgi:hypothetical protein
MCNFRNFLRPFLALLALIVMASTASAADPGVPLPTITEPSDSRPGTVLFNPFYTSNAINPALGDTRMSITNHSPFNVAFHIFLIDGASGSAADFFICLTPKQIGTMLASELDPGTTGYSIAVPVNSFGIPLGRVVESDGQVCTINPDGTQTYRKCKVIVSLFDGLLPGVDQNSVTADLVFDGLTGYGRLPRTLVLDVPSSADARTQIVISRIGGNLVTGMGNIGPIFGLLFDDSETPFSFTFNANSSQFIGVLSDSFPRTVPRLSSVIPAGRIGWMKFRTTEDNVGILGSMESRGQFGGGLNLSHLTLSSRVVLTIPIVPPSC